MSVFFSGGCTATLLSEFCVFVFFACAIGMFLNSVKVNILSRNSRYEARKVVTSHYIQAF